MILIPLSDLSIFSCEWLLLHGHCFHWCFENWRWRRGSFVYKLKYSLWQKLGTWPLGQLFLLCFCLFRLDSFLEKKLSACFFSFLFFFLVGFWSCFTLLLGFITSVFWEPMCLFAVWIEVFILLTSPSFLRSPHTKVKRNLSIQF